MTILLHICCGPCTTYPLKVLRGDGHEVRGYFFNPNIHPYREFKARLAAVTALAEQSALAVDYQREYGLTEYLRQVVFHEQHRCGRCYAMRLAATVEHAKAIGATAFSTTLLYSRYQKHELICRIAEELARRHDLPFLYRDFRTGWQEGIDAAVAMGLYRQAYCGCIYSEQERYDQQWRRQQKTAKQNPPTDWPDITSCLAEP